MRQLLFSGKRASNNRKETKGRAARKQHSLLYTTNVEKREELADKWRAEGVPSYEIERRFRKESLFLHRN